MYEKKENDSYLQFSEKTTSIESSPNPFNTETQKDKNIAIFDWDDTLFCTKYFENFNINLQKVFDYKTDLETENPFLKKEILNIEDSIIDLFSELLDNNFEIKIISNADLKWIENCLTHFLFDLKEFIEENQIKIYSAKNLFKNDNFFLWKKKCFKKVITESINLTNCKLNILSIGDSNEEKKASLNLLKLKQFKNIKVSIVQFISNPSANSIIKQLNYILENYLKIVKSKKIIHKIYINDKKLDIQVRHFFYKLRLINKEKKNCKRFKIKFLNKKRSFEIKDDIFK